MAYVLSCKGELVDISWPQSNLCDHITQSKLYFNLLRRARRVDFQEEDGLILTKCKRIYIPSYENLQWDVMKEYHASKWVG